MMSPKSFMEGGKYQASWFSKLPPNHDSYVYYMCQICSLVMLSFFVIPVFISPSSKFLVCNSTIMYAFMCIHFHAFLSGFGAYKDVKPTRIMGGIQWFYMFAIFVILFILSLLGCVENDTILQEYNTHKHMLPLLNVNIVVVFVSSIFSLVLISFPTQLLSIFWEEKQDTPVIVCGLKQLTKHGVVNWYARIAGFAILSVNLSTIVHPIDGIEHGLKHPLYSVMNLLAISLITLFNFNVIMMRQYDGISEHLLKMSWIPTLIIGCILSTLLILVIT